MKKLAPLPEFRLQTRTYGFQSRLLAIGLLVAAPVGGQAAPSVEKPPAAPVIVKPPFTSPHLSRKPVENLAGTRPHIDVASERGVRTYLHLAGYTDPTLVNVVVTFVRQKNQARASLLKTADRLAQALSTPHFDNKKLNELCDLFEVELDEERDRTQSTEKELDEQIKWSGNKRLTATLILAGVVGDSAGLFVTPASEADSDAESAPALEGQDNDTE